MIRNQIQAITQTLTTPTTFIYGTVNELNQLADDAQFPCIFMYPLQPVEVSPQINGSVDNTFSVYLVTSGNIKSSVLYIVYGAQSVTYNGTTYITNQTFRGITGVANYAFSGLGTQLVYELLEEFGASIEYFENSLDYPVFPEITKLSGFAIEYLQDVNDIIFNDITALNGFAIELIDNPFYSFQITENSL